MHPKIFGKNLNNRQKLANHILEWSSSTKGGINLYALGSHWRCKHEVAPDVVERAIGEIDAILEKDDTHSGCYRVRYVKELKDLKAKIKRAVK